MEILTILLAAACIVCILFAFYWMREQSEIRREKRTGLTPPDSNGRAQGIVIPLDVVYSVQRDLSELVVGIEHLRTQVDRIERAQAQAAGRRVLERFSEEEESNATTSDTLLDNQ